MSKSFKKLTPRVKSKVFIHDKSQLETVFDYQLISNEFSGGGHYEVDLFMFFPPQMVINVQTYSREQFYQDIHTLLRFKEPKYSFKAFLGEKKGLYESPLVAVKKYVCGDNYANNDDNLQIKNIRMIACFFANYVKRHLRKRIKSINFVDGTNSFSSNLMQCEYLLQRCRTIIVNIIELLISAHNKQCDHEVIKELNLCCEYCLYIINNCIARLALAMSQKHVISDNKALFLKAKGRFALWNRYFGYVGNKVGVTFVTEDSDENNLEVQTRRFRDLKRRMYEVLYLAVLPKTSFLVQRQLGYMFAAGLAAVWALAANIVIWHKTNFSGYGANNLVEQLFGVSGFIVLLAFIFSYALKDRIKDLLRSNLVTKFLFRLPDSREKIWCNSIEKKKFPVGIIQESMHFLGKYDSVPAVIKKLRMECLGNSQVQGEQVICYKKQVWLNSQKLRRLEQPIFYLRDITRLSVHRFVQRMDNPMQHVPLINRQGLARVAIVPKLYCIDVALAYKSRSNNKYKVSTCHRLWINKKGIVKIT